MTFFLVSIFILVGLFKNRIGKLISYLLLIGLLNLKIFNNMGLDYLYLALPISLFSCLTLFLGAYDYREAVIPKQSDYFRFKNVFIILLFIIFAGVLISVFSDTGLTTNEMSRDRIKFGYMYIIPFLIAFEIINTSNRKKRNE